MEEIVQKYSHLPPASVVDSAIVIVAFAFQNCRSRYIEKKALQPGGMNKLRSDSGHFMPTEQPLTLPTGLPTSSLTEMFPLAAEISLSGSKLVDPYAVSLAAPSALRYGIFS